MDIGEFLRMMEDLCPQSLAEEWDTGRIGLVIQGTRDIGTVCCALDATPAVVQNAIQAGADILVVHHTPLWSPVTSLTGPLAGLMRLLLSSGMHLFVMHSNFDHASGGINDALAEVLGMSDSSRLSLGIVGDCPLTVQEVSDRLMSPLIVYGTPPLPGRLAVAGGAAFDPVLITEAVDRGAESFLSADLKHSIARSSPLPLIEATHYALEAPGMKYLAEKMGWSYIDDRPVVNAWKPRNSGEK
ncbi:MAG: Nif3-like dinuclear metal center hexameric protein [Methanolinea sp.]|nr:Nif3-like dinuclear metal center hexameric protein [Methanolinea sp.]